MYEWPGSLVRASALLPLHRGRAPRWLFGRMVKLAKYIAEIIIHEYGVRVLLTRLSDPWFFQSLSCVLGYDWHSSGTTTVTCRALKEAIEPSKLGVAVAGGKGRTSRKTPDKIEEFGDVFGFSSFRIDKLKYASKMTAKVDNALIQDGYNIYHHTFIFDEDGDWIVIQQGINENRGNARRYHWPPDSEAFIDEPQNAILCESRLKRVLDLTSSVSRENREVSLDLARESPRRLRKLMVKPVAEHQKTLDGWTGTRIPSRSLVMPATINWKAMKEIYEFQPKSYEELVSLRGVGPSTVRGLSLVAELLYGEEASWRDPVRFSFAFGGKDGVPFPVDRRAMDEATDLLRTAIQSTHMKMGQRQRALKSLRKCVPPIPAERLIS
ncbi:MAG: DUF763 domain-containing protein [Candidatus Bathyarchaeota archaeon]|nr:MAG: DUF763 domain-containing protein [Candidatus Bathyarchaeota archaeon]